MVGEAFFPCMVEVLAQALSVRWVLLCTLHPVNRQRARTVAVWDDGPAANFEYELEDTPCANIVASGTCAYARGVTHLFPKDVTLQEMGAESYVGAPLRSANGDVLGLLAVLGDKPLEDEPLAAEMVEVFAARAATEIERVVAASISERLGRVESVRVTASEMLIELGYKVLKAKDADSALAILNSGVTIDLLFTDVVMPGVLKSTELAEIFLRRFERGVVLYTSGYTQNSIVHAGQLDEGVDLLSKPYSREALARKVRQVLDGRT